MEDLLASLREQRESRGLSQQTVGRHMGTTQPAVARLENAGADPRLGTLKRYAEAVGATLEVAPARRVDLPATAHAVAHALSGGEFDTALRHVIQLLDDLSATEPTAVSELLRREPPLTGDGRFDALIAAVCECAAHSAGVATPGWTAAPSRFLDRWWFPVEDILGRLPDGIACYALAASPPEFAVRGVFVDPDTLESA